MKKKFNSNKLPKDIKKFLDRFPTDAKNWKDATDEVRDLCRFAREIYNEVELGVNEESEKALQPLDFMNFKTPAAWNLNGHVFIKATYSKMGPEAREHFVNTVRGYFPIN